MIIYSISDTHGFHRELTDDINRISPDMIIHAGDISNSYHLMQNHMESMDFLTWYDNLNIKHKILIGGNHDGSLEKRLINFDEFKTIKYIEHDLIEIEGLKIFGSPYTPIFGNWYFNLQHNKLLKKWKQIPSDIDILVTHGPPKGILDLTIDFDKRVKFCGDKHLYNVVMDLKPQYHIFGHIHNGGELLNNGIRTINNHPTKFINASCVKDNAFDLGIVNEGIVIEI